MTIRPDLMLEYGDTHLPKPARPSRSWRGFAVEHVDLDGPEPFHYQWAGKSHYLALHDIVLTEGEVWLDALVPDSGNDLRDTITFIPAGHAIEGWSSPLARHNSFTVLYFDPDQLREELADKYANATSALAPVLYAKDGQLHATMNILCAILTNPNVEEVYAESACILAAFQALSLRPDLPSAGRLTQKQFKLVIDYIAEHMTRDIGLTELATAAGLSRYHFGRAFKATTGQSPYAYLLARRVEKAEELLSSGKFPLEEVAHRAGFRNLAAMRRHFRNIRHETPRTFRRERW